MTVNRSGDKHQLPFKLSTTFAHRTQSTGHVCEQRVDSDSGRDGVPRGQTNRVSHAHLQGQLIFVFTRRLTSENASNCMTAKTASLPAGHATRAVRNQIII